MAKASVINNNGSIAIKFMLNGYLYKLGKLGKCEDSQAKALAERLCLSINADIASGNFTASSNDELFAIYHPRAKLEARHTANKSASEAMVKQSISEHEAFDLWLEQYKGKQSFDSIRLCLKLTDIAPTTYNARIVFAKKFGRWLVSEGYRSVNPYEALKTVKVTKLDKVQNRDAFTGDEVKLILEAFKTDKKVPHGTYERAKYYDFVCLLAYTGLRTSEAIGLQVKHINFLASVLTVDSALARSNPDGKTYSSHSQRVRKSTKTGESRYIKLPIELTRQLEVKCSDMLPDDLIFGINGKPINDGTFRGRAWLNVLADLGIEYRPPYALRHTAISHYIANTKDVFAAAKFAGHKDTKQIMDTYGHLLQLPECPVY